MLAYLESPGAVRHGTSVVPLGDISSLEGLKRVKVEEGGSLVAGVIFLERYTAFLGVSEWVLIMPLPHLGRLNESLDALSIKLKELNTT